MEGRIVSKISKFWGYVCRVFALSGVNTKALSGAVVGVDDFRSRRISPRGPPRAMRHAGAFYSDFKRRLARFRLGEMVGFQGPYLTRPVVCSEPRAADFARGALPARRRPTVSTAGDGLLL